MSVSSGFTAFLAQEFHNELVLVTSLSSLGKLVYGFYALAAIMVIRPHIRQAMRYRHGEAGKGDFCHCAQYEAIVWRLAPLLYAFVINSKLLALSVLIDIAGRLWTIHESHQAEKRFMGFNRVTHLRQKPAEKIGVTMRGVNSLEPEALPTKPPSAKSQSDSVKPCPFCDSDKATAIEIDMEIWAACCIGCGTIGPHAGSLQLAITHWNSPLTRQAA